jgi:hypothetical protein
VGTAAMPHDQKFLVKNLAASRDIKKNHFGNVEITEVFEADENSAARVLKTVHLSNKDFVRDYERQTRVLEQAKIQAKVNKERMTENKIFTCNNRGNVNPESPDDAAVFIPVNVGALNINQKTITYTAGTCYQNIVFTYSQSGSGSEVGDVTVTVQTSNAQSLFCNDWFFFATASIQHIETFYLSGTHQIVFKNLSPDA